MERVGTGSGYSGPWLFPRISVTQVETLPLTVPSELTWGPKDPSREDNIQSWGKVGGGEGLSPSQAVGHGRWGQ